MKITTNTNAMVEQFCHSILQLEIRNSKPLVNLVMGLASQTNARSVAEISLGDCYHYQYSSINKAVDAMFEAAEVEKEGQGDAATGRLDTEKKFVHQGRGIAKAL